MLSEHEVREIEDGRRKGLGGPLVLTWVDRLLADRKERIHQLAYARKRLEQAYRYIDKLLTSAEPVPKRGGDRHAHLPSRLDVQHVFARAAHVPDAAPVRTEGQRRAHERFEIDLGGQDEVVRGGRRAKLEAARQRMPPGDDHACHEVNTQRDQPCHRPGTRRMRLVRSSRRLGRVVVLQIDAGSDITDRRPAWTRRAEPT